MKRARIFASFIIVLLVLSFVLCVPAFAKSISGPFPFSQLDPDKYTVELGRGGYVKDLDEGVLEQQGIDFYIHKKVVDENGNETTDTAAVGYAYVKLLETGNLTAASLKANSDFKWSTDLYTPNMKERDYAEYLQEWQDTRNSREDSYGENYEGNITSDSYSIRFYEKYASGLEEVSVYYWRTVPEIPGLYICYFFGFDNSKRSIAEGEAMMDSLKYADYTLEWNDTMLYDESLVFANVESDASMNGGDTDFTIPAAIVVGLTSAGAALGAALGVSGAGAAAANPDTAEKEINKEYKMVVSKTFGDAIRRGADPVEVKAKIVEIDGTSQTDRADLTKMITASASIGLEVKSLVFDNTWVVAKLYADADGKQEKAGITFTFAGKGGTFTNTVNFRLIDKGRIRFPEQAPGTTVMTLPVIAGDSGTYRVIFVFDEAISEPTKINISGDERFEIRYEPEERERSFYAYVTNRTEPLENAVFRKPESVGVHIEAFFENDDKVEGDFDIEIHPKGLTATSYEIENDRMVIQAFENETASEWDLKIHPTSFEVFYATSDLEDGYMKAKFLAGKELNPVFGGLKGDAEYADNFRETFHFEIDDTRAEEGKYDFVPKDMLPQDNQPYEMDLEISCSAEGVSDTQVLPLMLKGKRPPKAPDNWEKEYEMLKKDIAYFGLGENKYLRETIRNAKSMTGNEICMIRRAIISEATSYYKKEGREFTDLDASLGRYEFVFSSVKWIADQAFAYMVSVYGGGPYVEAFASPMKDMIGEFLGQLTASSYWGTDVKMGPCDLVNAFISGVENAASNYMGDAMGSTPVSIKKIGYVCASMLTIGFIKRYAGISDNGDYAGDIYNSLVKSFGDLTSNVMKNLFNTYLGKVLDSDKGFCAKLGNYLKKNIGPEMEMKSADIVAKYLSETFGLVVSNVYGNLMADTKDVVNEDGTFNIIITVGNSELKINPIANLKAIQNLMYNMMIAPFTSVAKPLQTGNCEKYYKS